MTKKYLTTSELGKKLGVSRITIFKRIRAGDIKAEKIGRNFAIAEDDLPGILNAELTQEKKDLIKKAIKKTVAEYGETLKRLGKE